MSINEINTGPAPTMDDVQRRMNQLNIESYHSRSPISPETHLTVLDEVERIQTGRRIAAKGSVSTIS